jgi:signal transduction histidine kinase
LLHHIAVVSVQAGAAQHLLTADPAAAAVAVGEVRRAAVTVLDELKDLLYVLRQPGEPDTGTAPVQDWRGSTSCSPPSPQPA